MAIPASVPQWRSYSITYANLAAAALSNDVQVLSLPALAIIQAIRVRPVIQFAGVGMGYYQVSLGIAGDLQSLTALYDVFAAVPGAGERQLTPVLDDESSAAAVSIRIYGESDILLNLATAGELEISVLYGTGF